MALPILSGGWGFLIGVFMIQTEFNEYGMDSSTRETSVIRRAEQLIDEGREPRKAYEQAVKENK